MLLAFLHATVCGLLRLLPVRGKRLTVSQIELLTLCHGVSATAIRMTTRRRRSGVAPAPPRAGLTWGVFLRAQPAGVLASAPPWPHAGHRPPSGVDAAYRLGRPHAVTWPGQREAQLGVELGR